MKTFKNILWATNGKDIGKKSWSRLLTVVKNNDARVTLVNVVDETPPDSSLLSGGSLLTSTKARKDFQRTQITKSQASLNGIVEKLNKTGIKASAKVLKGREFVEIIQRAIRFKHDLVIRNAEDSKKASFFSSENEDIHLLRNCPCPVLLMRPKVRADHPLLLAAVNPDPLNPERDALNKLILSHTLALEQSFKKCEIHIVNAWDIHREVGARLLPNSETKMMSYREKRRRADLVESMIDNFEGFKSQPTVHILKGDPKKIIPKVAKDIDAGVVIMGTICRTGIPGMIVGTTAEPIMSKLDCTILAIKPEGFVSSVTVKKHAKT